MSRKKKHGRPRVKPDETPPIQATRRPSRERATVRRTVTVALTVLATVAGAILVARWRTRDGGPAQHVALPPPVDTAAPTAPAASEFAGAQRCASCHAAQYATWRASTHGNAGGVPGDVRVIAPFDGTPIRFRDAVVIPAASGRRYTFTVRQDGHPPRTFAVDGVVGGGHMEGGGTQGFVSRFPDGTWRFLPFDWSRHDATWFCNTTSRAGKGWVRVTPDLSLADCGDWPPQRVLGDEPRFANCQGCHGSRVDVGFDTVAKRWETTVASLTIDCESCHGPAKQHVTLMASGASDGNANRVVGAPTRSVTDIGLRSLATLDKERSLDVCLQCHALKSQLAKQYRPGASLASFYSVRLAQLGDAALLPDGRTRTFAYQESHYYSACYRQGGMTCTSCHDPHSQGYRDAFGVPLAGRFDDRQCTSCHASKADRPTQHTKHKAGSPGSRCTACHMPYLQQPDIGRAIRYARADHSIPIPRPSFDAAEGVPSACRTCHADRTDAALDAQVRRWYGAPAPHDPAVAGLARSASARSRPDAARMLLVTESQHTSAVVAGLSRFVERWLAPDMTELEADVSDRLRKLAEHRDLDVRATALAALHYARGEQDEDTRRFLARALRASSARDDAPLRDRWSLVLGFLADSLLAHADADAAVRTYRKAIEVTPRAPRVHLNLGLAQAKAGDVAGAVASYRRSLELDAQQPLALVNLGIALEATGDAAGAEQAYRRAMTIDPNEPLAYFNLGNVFLKRGDAAAAIPLYTRVTSLAPSIAAAHFYLADAYVRTGALQPALDALRHGLEFEPANADARAAEARLAQALGTMR